MSSVTHRPEVLIEGAGRVSTRVALREVWAYRGTVLAFAERNVRARYRQTLLGAAWVGIQPLVFMAVFTVALGRLADVPSGGTTYAAFSLSAFVVWSFVLGAVSQGANALVNDAAFLRKVYFPREVPVLATQLSAVLDFGVGLLIFCAVGPLLGAQASLAWLLAPLLFAGVVLLTTGVSLLLASLNAYYRDFGTALPFLLQLWLFASPVVYPATVVPEGLRPLYATLNPAAGLLDSFRRVLAAGELPDPAMLFPSLASACLVLYAGHRVFRRLEPNLADVV